jgi:hypothetical protein
MSVTFSKPFIFGQVLVWGGVAVAAAVIIIAGVLREYERYPYQKNIETYLEKPPGIPLVKKIANQDSVAINGKLVAVNLDKNAIDPVFNQLPQELKPEKPDQVKTVLWIKCNRIESSLKYSDGSPAYNNECTLTFIDLINKKYLWTDKVMATPPSSKRKGTDSDVEDPTTSILFYLQQIPHKV